MEKMCAIENDNKELKKEVSGLRKQLIPVVNFFQEESAPLSPIKKRLTAKEKLELEIEEHSKMLEKQSFERIKNANSKNL